MGSFDKDRDKLRESKLDSKDSQPPVISSSKRDKFSIQSLRISPLNGLLIIATFGLWLPVMFIFQSNSKSGDKQTNHLLIAKAQDQINQILPEINHHDAIRDSIDKMDEVEFQNGLVIQIQKVRLYEARQGSSMTRTSGSIDSETKTGTVGVGVGLGSIGVGLAASKGQTTGITNSTSVTKVTGDEMVKIDIGDLMLTPQFFTFTGEKFTKQVSYADLLSCQIVNNEIIISSSENEKNSLFAFNTDSVAEIIGQCINQAKKDFGKEVKSSDLRAFLTQIDRTNSENLQPLLLELQDVEQRLKDLTA